MSSKSWLSTNYFLQFAVNGLYLPFWILYLTSVKNLSVLEASSIFSMLYLARFLSGIFLSPYLLKKFSMNLALKITVISGVILAASYGFTNDKILLTIITFMFGLLYFTVAPFIESLASLFLKEENVDYGKARTYGSLSFTIVGIIVGGVVGYLGAESIKTNKKEKLYSWVLKDKNAFLLILVVFIYQLSHTAYNNYNAIYLDSMNISAKWISGLILNISVIAEILFFIFSKKIVSKIKPTSLLIFSGIAATVRWVMIAIFHNIYIFTLMQTLHALTFAAAHIAFILILDKRYNREKIIDMQNLYTAICFQLSMTVGLYIMGAIWDFNTSYVFHVSAIFALIGTIVATRIEEV